jgi:hypothetical protein
MCGNFEAAVRMRDVCVVVVTGRVVVSGLCSQQRVATSRFATVHPRDGGVGDLQNLRGLNPYVWFVNLVGLVGNRGCIDA